MFSREGIKVSDRQHFLVNLTDCHGQKLRYSMLPNQSNKKTKYPYTFSNGCLGSHNDEERSEMRYVMRIARPVSHQIFERTLRFVGLLTEHV